jgi:hypothetical protein
MVSVTSWVMVHVADLANLTIRPTIARPSRMTSLERGAWIELWLVSESEEDDWVEEWVHGRFSLAEVRPSPGKGPTIEFHQDCAAGCYRVGIYLLLPFRKRRLVWAV